MPRVGSFSLPASQFKDLYLYGFSISEISKLYAYSYTKSVNRHLRRLGVTRTISEARKLLIKQRPELAIPPPAFLIAGQHNRFNPAKTPWKGNPELHPLWIKDRSKLKSQRNINELRHWRKAVFQRDDYTCRYCNKRGCKLNAHHLKPYRDYPLERESLDNGITLCLPCHKKTDTYGIKILKGDRLAASYK